jgi:glutaredoxin
MKLTVYSSKNCPRCRALKKWLRKNKLSFIEKSLDDTDVMTELVMRNLFVLSTPAIETENRVYLSDQIFAEYNSLNPAFTEVLRGEKTKTKKVWIKPHRRRKKDGKRKIVNVSSYWRKIGFQNQKERLQ